MDKAANDNRGADLISILSTTLANIDVEYEFDLARLRVTAKPNLRAMIMNTVRQRHIERRAPYETVGNWGWLLNLSAGAAEPPARGQRWGWPTPVPLILGCGLPRSPAARKTRSFTSTRSLPTQITQRTSLQTQGRHLCTLSQFRNGHG
jgi:hypothetical protein